MPAVNGIQPAIFSGLQPQVTPGGGGRVPGEDSGAGLVVDVYSGGTEAWRNRATAAGGQVSCRCGSCPACAAQEYASQGKRLDGQRQNDSAEPGNVEKAQEAEAEQDKATASGPKGVDGEELSQQEQAELAELKKTDRAVRAHEQAHLAAAGSLVQRGVSLSYEKGPDGQRYAVAGEVSIDTSKEADPADTVTKMRTVRAAALAPADPSPQDRKVAAAATATMNAAMREVRMQEFSKEEAENSVKRGAEKVAGRGTEDASTQGGISGPSADNPGAAGSPAPGRASQHYMASASTLAKRLVVTA